MADKVAQLADPRTVRLYRLIGRIAQDGEDDELLRETAELIHELLEEAEASGELQLQGQLTSDATFTGLVDSFAGAAHPAVGRLRELLAERGWTGWTVVEERKPAPSRRGSRS